MIETFSCSILDRSRIEREIVVSRGRNQRLDKDTPTSVVAGDTRASRKALAVRVEGDLARGRYPTIYRNISRSLLKRDVNCGLQDGDYREKQESVEDRGLIQIRKSISEVTGSSEFPIEGFFRLLVKVESTLPTQTLI